MLKEYLQKHSISIYKTAKDLNIPYSTLNDIANNRKSIEKCEYGLVKNIAAYLDVSLQELEKICNATHNIYSQQFHVKGEISVRSKKYHIIFLYQDNMYDIELCKVNNEIIPFLEEVALYEMEKYIKIMQMEEILCSMF